MCAALSAYGQAAAPADIESAVDSALIMADTYADALKDKPEMAPTRLKVLRNFGNAKSAEVRDSICSRLYDFFVNYTEQDKTDRAAAFKDCFMALAGADNPGLGPLYAAELAIARENTDTTTLKKYIPLLEEYATRLGYDYDDELDEAKGFIDRIRVRRHIDDDLVGVWISDEFLKYPLASSTYGFSAKQVFSVMGGNGYSAALKDLEQETAIMTLNILAFGRTPTGSRQLVSLADKKKGFLALQRSECEAFDIPADNPKIREKSGKRTSNWVYNTIRTVTDNNSRWLYGLWGTEQLRRNDPELSAALRQSIQHTQAQVAGHFSRSKYSFGEEMLANTLASGFSAISNGIIDHFSVSKDKIYSAEVNLQLQHPDKMIGRLDIINVEVRSDRETPKVKERNAEVSYYRWTPEDNIFFLTTLDTYVPLFEPSKAENERMKRIVSQAREYWQANGSGKWFYQWFNETMFAKLKNKTGEAAPLAEELKNLLEI